ncbi:hypothetical protein [Intestinimonas massiliensis (ex Afouda et al. 2020)]|uniref:hypothetical protein n=1 Tax=Intestinimonas massiliensis (ex Afouda et al. 2020) TaxID=1673721 RepID=UPI00102FAA9C|nr:hypothetical protein [Intestinimonas massiliensis (ex Afouda et al. 2020)]
MDVVEIPGNTDEAYAGENNQDCHNESQAPNTGDAQTCSVNDAFTIEDSLNLKQIDQLHNATLNFSNNSLETKKLCVTAEIASITLLIGLHENDKITNLFLLLGISSLIIALLFYIIDVCFYYYQDKLRDTMVTEENKIRYRHRLPAQEFNRRTIVGNKIFDRIFRSLLNGSQIMYWILMLVSVVILIVF